MTPPPTDRARALANMLDQLHANACGKHHAKVYKDVCAVVEKMLRTVEAETRERCAKIAENVDAMDVWFEGEDEPNAREFQTCRAIAAAIREAKP